jgi:DNA-directed RNA polymerase specialized sigma24 family protein
MSTEQEAATKLVALVADGNTEAYQALRALYWKRVCAAASDAGTSDTLIEEIADYAFDTMRNRATTYDPSKDFWPWLRGIAKNAPKNVLRSHKSRREREKKWTYVHQLPDTGSMTIHVRHSLARYHGERRRSLATHAFKASPFRSRARGRVHARRPATISARICIAH